MMLATHVLNDINTCTENQCGTPELTCKFTFITSLKQSPIPTGNRPCSCDACNSGMNDNMHAHRRSPFFTLGKSLCFSPISIRGTTTKEIHQNIRNTSGYFKGHVEARQIASRRCIGNIRRARYTFVPCQDV